MSTKGIAPSFHLGCLPWWLLDLIDTESCFQFWRTLSRAASHTATMRTVFWNTSHLNTYIYFFLQTTVSTTMIFATLSSQSWCSKVTGRQCPTPSLSTARKLFLRKSVQPFFDDCAQIIILVNTRVCHDKHRFSLMNILSTKTLKGFSQCT